MTLTALETTAASDWRLKMRLDEQRELPAFDFERRVGQLMDLASLALVLGWGLPEYQQRPVEMEKVTVVRSSYGSPLEIDFTALGSTAAYLIAGATSLSVVIATMARTAKEWAERRKLNAEAVAQELKNAKERLGADRVIEEQQILVVFALDQLISPGHHHHLSIGQQDTIKRILQQYRSKDRATREAVASLASLTRQGLQVIVIAQGPLPRDK